jgi:predicted nucleic acid-binding protein
MRTIVRFDELIYRVKQLAAQSGKTMMIVIKEALRKVLARQDSTRDRKPVRLTTVSDNGLQPGVDLAPDAYLAALAIESGSEWITTDRDFDRFPDCPGGILLKSSAEGLCAS